MQDLLDEIREFQIKTFPTATVISKLYHLTTEVSELIAELDHGAANQKQIQMEYADCFILLLGSAGIHGLNSEDIYRAVREKLEINKKRKWGPPDENGVMLHIK